MNKVNLNKSKEKVKDKIKNSKLIKSFDKLRKFVVEQSDYMILLIMLLTISTMYEPYGLTRTIPLVLIIPFFLGVYYKGRRRILIDAVIAMIILASVSGDVPLSATIIIVGSICTFAGLYLSKCIDHFKRYKWYRKIISGIIAFTLLLVGFVIYIYKFGNPLGVLEAQDYVAFEAKEELSEYGLMGTRYNSDINCYDVEYVNLENYEDKKVYHYNSAYKKIITDEMINKTNEENEEVKEITEEN